jgi:HTH-type transcriptional regulator/antitoxin HigA
MAIEKLRESLQGRDDASITAVLRDMQREALTSQIEELEEDVAEYDALKSGRVTQFTAEGLNGLPDILIRARIARGMSQKDLADFLGLKEQQVQRYEAERYRSASLERLIEVSDALGVQIQKRAELLGDTRLGAIDLTTWQAFPIAEMYKRGWFEDFSGSMVEARKAASELVPAFLRGSQARYAAVALHRKSVRASGQVLEAAVAAWEARIRQLAERNPPEVRFERDHIDDAWLRGLVALTLNPEGAAKAIAHLRAIGIALVVERQLPGTLLDGAALCSVDDYAIVGLTLRHDRLDNFWFTLFHEIAHLKLHIGQGAFAAIFDDMETPATDQLEGEADNFAQEALLPAAKWNMGVSRFSRTAKAVLTDAKRFGVGPAVIAGRVRREAQDYTLLRGLIGTGDVRRQFGL